MTHLLTHEEARLWIPQQGASCVSSNVTWASFDNPEGGRPNQDNIHHDIRRVLLHDYVIGYEERSSNLPACVRSKYDAHTNLQEC